MAENRRDQNQGFYRFSRGQLALLAVGFTLTSVVVFSLGILIGQRIEERKLVQKEEPLVKIPVPPLSQGSGQRQGASTKEDITFYDALAKVTGDASVAPVEKPKEAKAVEQKAEGVKEKSAPQVQDQSEKTVQQGAWTIQVNAFRDESDAQGLSQQLKKKGYDAYVVSANIRGRTWHRVRVGHFSTREEANAMQEQLKTKERLAKAITVSR